MKKVLFAFILNAFFYCGYGQTTIRLDSSASIVLQYKFNQDENLFKALKQMNKTIIYATVIYSPDDNAPILFAASKYKNDDVVSIDSAFNQTVKHIPNGMSDGYKLIDYGKYDKEGKMLRFKLSKLVFANGQEVYNLMYYFMKDNKSDELYELKVSGKEEDLEKDKKILEEISLTLTLK